MKILSYGLLLEVKINCFSKVHDILKLRWFMLRFFIYALIYDLYMCSYSTRLKFKN